MSLLTIEDQDHGLRCLILNRPEKLNALSKTLVDELISAVKKSSDDAQSQRIRALVICSSSEKAFCVGADLAERMTMNESEVSETLLRQRRLMDGITELQVPTFAVIEGAAFGGGFELALACDFRFVSSKALMGLTETRLAIIPGAGGTQRLAQLVGRNKAKEMIFLARRVSGTEAAHLKIVNACVDRPMDLVKEWAKEFQMAGPVAIQAAKKAIDGGASLPMAEALDFERECYSLVLKTEDRLEGLKAFSEKRSPNYKGK